MIIDTHCHFDMMPCPEAYINQVEAEGNISIGMTNLPSHFLQGYDIVRQYKHVRLALGFHPLLITDNYKEMDLFKRQIRQTSYIGEIGLDFSKEGILSKNSQIECFKEILSTLKNTSKIISVHSKKAERDILALLEKHDVKNVILHWYTGPIELVPRFVDMGCYFSVNESMTYTAAGQKIISSIPQNRLLTESDAPYNKKNSIARALINMGIDENIIQKNFNELITCIK